MKTNLEWNDAIRVNTHDLRIPSDLLLKTLGEEDKSDALLSSVADTKLSSQAAVGISKLKIPKAV